jgi:hypothetical protein
MSFDSGSDSKKKTKRCNQKTFDSWNLILHVTLVPNKHCLRRCVWPFFLHQALPVMFCNHFFIERSLCGILYANTQKDRFVYYRIDERKFLMLNVTLYSHTFNCIISFNYDKYTFSMCSLINNFIIIIFF